MHSGIALRALLRHHFREKINIGHVLLDFQGETVATNVSDSSPDINFIERLGERLLVLDSESDIQVIQLSSMKA